MVKNTQETSLSLSMITWICTELYQWLDLMKETLELNYSEVDLTAERKIYMLNGELLIPRNSSKSK